MPFSDLLLTYLQILEDWGLVLLRPKEGLFKKSERIHVILTTIPTRTSSCMIPKTGISRLS
jgi:hypothetical protein